MRSLLFLSLVSASFALQLPFKVPFFQSTVPPEDDEPVRGTPKIAIIGAGAAGSSAAFWISKAQERFGVDVEVDVYEKTSRIGGRSLTVYPHGNDTFEPVELGASIFVKANKNLWRAAQEFNLTLRDLSKEDNDLGIWDGEQLLLNLGNHWWDTLKVLWRYGVMPPRRAEKLVAEMLKQYSTLYTADSPKWDNITDLAHSFGWKNLIESTGAEFFTSNGVSKQYVFELIEAASRVNYGQNIDSIHALEAACSIAANGASQIEGGNWQIFERFLNHSRANVFTDTKVTRITQKESKSRPWVVHSAKGPTGYKAVILAAPFHQTDIELPSTLASQIPEQPYVHLHVTLLTTTSPNLNREYLALSPNEKVPSMLLTTYDGVRQGRKAPEFNSISYHGKISEDEWVVKIFSESPVEDKWLQSLFNDQVGWVHRAEFDAYPKLPPTSSFPPVKLDHGLFYVNAFEPFISTMETETLASRNVVDLLLNEEFSSSICGPRISGSTKDTAAPDSDFVFGWDC
ncbi:Prenylcysteine lyase-domain-containing protein [Lentinula edodes]|uniref:Prenylcysteine lyase-domain-containing protein n=1 Tax=Lentinula edodes TaxID=5353 RepID=UPI001E8D0C0C|nr:Prenylcysteine lyase-domain-containing protein [Lentinula edodes]KAH7875610.1 Prenylcysteine lyase-domain-containing protein [Lentinula edodes]